MMYFPIYKGMKAAQHFAVRGIRDATSFALPSSSWFNGSILSFRSRTF